MNHRSGKGPTMDSIVCPLPNVATPAVNSNRKFSTAKPLQRSSSLVLNVLLVERTWALT